MPQVRLEKFLFVSFLIHITLAGTFILNGLLQDNRKKYYAVDFYAGSPSAGQMSDGGSSPASAVQETPKAEPVKIKTINPKEDLLIKSHKKEKRVKEVVSEIPSIPIPSAKPRTKAEEQGSGIPSAVPSASDGSGVGVGFGSDGYRGGSAGNFPYQWYVHTVKTKLDENWNVTEGFSKRIYTQVAFTIRRDGILTEIDIEEGSGNEVFDRAAKRAVEMTNPCPPLPSDFKEPSLRVHVRFTVKR